MKFKLLVLIILSVALSSSLYATSIPLDSIGIENLNGKKVILHKLDPKDNFYSIGRKYGVSPKVIMDFNKNAKMAIGAIIKVPTERSIVETTGTPAQQTQAQPAVQQPAATQPAAVQTKPATQPPVVSPPPATQGKPVITQPAPVAANNQAANNANPPAIQQYKVSAGETLYSIAKRFGTTVEDLTKLNNLKSTIMPGQVLQVRTGTPPPPQQPVAQQQDSNGGIPPRNAGSDSLITRRDSTYLAPDSLDRRGTNRYGLFEKNEKGVATYIDDASLDPNKKLILHRTAPIGTVMRLTNPMTGKFVFAKVVGRFTDDQATRDVIVVMTKNVAQSIGAIDKRFQVNISYGTPNE
ncbi:LysM peptidoglycan-binding domain-containing protein [Mucilaginibacter pallidiroseus]|uniref:LysM peptidoglycan-binding domain-containing protein n=1 Tax=Mucilaginibacter pallidiroseus TaxID=2599295 RepID=A0A563UBV1_9SPHI|nr:LysM peptidoglycan-binding domain-containing protein [Mucilaginibacter pallidiroseus]TWR28814.1 LysM peptidoglycan-binding domain-containing protein [Mucilaginibacter pallidiroseus]